MDSQDKKVDKDWKNQIKKEKSEAPPEKEKPSTGPDSTEGIRTAPPPVDLGGLVTGLALQALVSMGQVKTQEGEALPPDLPQAKHLIDTLDMLKKKTEGNVTPEEQALFQEWLYRLHMTYAEKVQQLSSGEGETP